MEITIVSQPPVTVIQISGSVDGLTADTLLSALTEQVRGGNTRLVADFSAVLYTSSAGLRVLLTTVKETRQRGGDFRIAAVNPNVHKVLELSGFTSILKVFGDVEAAVSSFLP
jgi:anti-sigma B factor antagonist